MEPARLLVLARWSRGDLLALALRGVSHELVMAGTAEAGLAHLGDPARFELCVWDTDVPMPAWDENLRKGRWRAPFAVVVLASPPMPAPMAAARRPGRLDVLCKPVDGPVLAAAVDGALRIVRARRLVVLARESFAGFARSLEALEDVLTGGGVGVGAPRVASGLPGLSAREAQMARALAEGHRVNEIARSFSLSPHTVRNHFKAIFRKLGVHSQVELVARLRT